MFAFWVFSSNGFRLPKGFLECSPNCSAHSSQSLARFLGINGCCFRRGSVEGSPNHSLHLFPKWLLLQKKFLGEFHQLRFTFISQPPGGKAAWIVDMSQPYKSSPQIRPIISLLLGYSLGAFSYGKSNMNTALGLRIMMIRQKSPQKDVVNQRMGPKIPRRTTSPPCAARCGGITGRWSFIHVLPVELVACFLVKREIPQGGEFSTSVRCKFNCFSCCSSTKPKLQMPPKTVHIYLHIHI